MISYEFYVDKIPRRKYYNNNLLDGPNKEKFWGLASFTKDELNMINNGAHPFYKKLIAASGKEPRWNFAKYLIGRDGEVIDHYKSRVTPESEKLISAITAVL